MDLSKERFLIQTAESIGISAAARETGIAKENLRNWERRYGFPQPVRDINGERTYPVGQVEKLRVVRRLMDAGYRPGNILRKNVDELRELALDRGPAIPQGSRFGAELDILVSAIRDGDIRLLRTRLRWQLATLGMREFVMGLVADLNRAVGESWARGEILVSGEHLYSEQIETVLRAATAQSLVEPIGPKVLLTTLPGEQHKIGLLMLEAILAMERAECLPLGTQTPISDIVKAATAGNADIVALSFSAAHPAKAALEGLAELRASLPPQTAIWAGGDGVKGIRKRPSGVKAPVTLESAVSELARWRN
ncbi:MAG: MerR family transcriptional regulator [Betaproteobacteria bacterium]